ncbi:type I toxin-antitoxin system SymE family toxin [Pectobacterium versatile]|nr:SymE family type I addiction module toxin [Pectobacterium versatile]MCA6924601.1 type I toxin-antitoxin system SymE family toxin [Pectobacterium versatile]MCH5081369.1 type I toxin-antitoxin system SymE family toxin [Pectobacterium versatile]
MSQLTDTARRHHKSEPATPQALRYLKVGYVSCRHADRHDMARYYSRSLHLQGNWLEAAGFGTDTPVVVTVERGRLVIEIEIEIELRF